MRVTVSHNKSQEEATRLVDKAVNDLFTSMPAGPVQIVDAERKWNGSTMNFSFTGKWGFMKVPLAGTVLVTDKDITIDCDLPSFLTNLMPEAKVKAQIQSKVKALLT